jgi:hypothetical protein
MIGHGFCPYIENAVENEQITVGMYLYIYAQLIFPSKFTIAGKSNGAST